MAVSSMPSPSTNTQKGKMTSRSHSGLVAQPGQELARPDSHWEHQISSIQEACLFTFALVNQDASCKWMVLCQNGDPYHPRGFN